nr:hypothetical protein [Tanacetum cinerariifolium]
MKEIGRTNNPSPNTMKLATISIKATFLPMNRLNDLNLKGIREREPSPMPLVKKSKVNKEIDVASKLLHENIWSSFRRTPRSGLETEQLELLQDAIGSIFLGTAEDRWIKEVPIKVNIHAWKVRLDCLPTRLKLSRRSLDIPSIICPICGRGVESSAHLFFVCDLAKDNFRKICRWWNVEFMEIRSFDEWASWVDSPSKAAIFDDVVLFSFYW